MQIRVPNSESPVLPVSIVLLISTENILLSHKKQQDLINVAYICLLIKHKILDCNEKMFTWKFSKCYLFLHKLNIIADLTYLL